MPPAADKVAIALLQMSCAPEPRLNLEKAVARIEEAAKNHLITSEMAAWAHDVRLDANDQRHADVAASLPTTADAQKCVEFARALAEFLFVLPARVQRGRQQDATVQTNP